MVQAVSCRILACIPSGPGDPVTLSAFNFTSTMSREMPTFTSSSPTNWFRGTGIESKSSVVKTLLKIYSTPVLYLHLYWPQHPFQHEILQLRFGLKMRVCVLPKFLGVMLNICSQFFLEAGSKLPCQ